MFEAKAMREVLAATIDAKEACARDRDFGGGGDWDYALHLTTRICILEALA